MARNRVLEMINPDSEKVSGVFLGRPDPEDEIHDLAAHIVKEGDEAHDALCPHDETCRGVQAHVIDELKNELIMGQHTDSEVLSLTACVMYIMGVKAGKLMDKMGDNIIEQIMRQIKKDKGDE